MERLPLAEAARRLGLPVTAARKRVARGTLPAVKLDGQWYVDIPVSAPTGVPGVQADGLPTGTPASSPVEVTQAAEIAFLRSELEARRREVERLHTLLAQAQARVLPAVAVQAPAGAAETFPAPGKVDPAPLQRASWWRRLWRGTD